MTNFMPTELESEKAAVEPAAQAAGPASARRALRALRKSPSAMASISVIALIAVMATTAPLLAHMGGWGPYEYDSNAIDSNLGGLPKGNLGGISSDHWFGVEPQSGRDIFARIAYGAQVSLSIAVSATLLTTFVGVVLGTLAGFLSGWVDQVISRIMDVLMAFPALIFMIALLSALPAGNRPVLLVLVLSFFGWPYMARVIRGQTMSLAKREFVEAAQASGAKKGTIVFKEILPNLTGTVIVMSTLAVPGYIGTEAGLSFLGVGVVPPTASWGQMISSAVPWYATDPMYFFVPGLFLFLTVLSFTVFGDKLRQVIDGGEAH
jgi:peptide/nickel transport system permease protein